MESDLIKMVHIEFYGLPGCSKSTVSHILADIMRREGFKVIEPSYDLDHKTGRASRKLIKTAQMLAYSVTNPSKAAQIKKLVLNNGYSGSAAIPQISNIIQKLCVYEKQRNAADICIWDQGIVQAAVSLAVTGNISSAENEAAIVSMLPAGIRIIKVYICDDIDTVKARMAKRATNDSRVEKLTDERAKDELLSGFELACDKINADGGIVIKEQNADVNELADMLAVKVSEMI